MTRADFLRDRLDLLLEIQSIAETLAAIEVRDHVRLDGDWAWLQRVRDAVIDQVRGIPLGGAAERVH